MPSSSSSHSAPTTDGPGREIALRLCLSPHTIKQHTCSAYRKLRARNRTEAVTRAMALGLIA